MIKININNPEELKKFKLETSGFVSSYGFPYRLDEIYKSKKKFLEALKEFSFKVVPLKRLKAKGE